MENRRLQSSSTGGSSSIQANDAVVISVGENREHLSLLSGSRRQYSQSRSVRVSSMMAGSAPTSSHNEGTGGDATTSSLSVSIPTRHRMLNYYRLIVNRHPRGKSAFLVLLILFFETLAFFGALNGVKQLLPIRSTSTGSSCFDNSSSSSNHDIESFLLSLLYGSAGRVFYPITGVIADSYLGRYRVIHVGLWLLWIGFATNSLSFSFLHSLPMSVRTIAAILSISLFSAGTASVEAILIPFGVDQLDQGASSDELSSYFYYYIMARNAGAMVAVIVLVVIFDGINFSVISDIDKCIDSELKTEVPYAIQSLLAVMAITIALLILFCMKSRFYQDRQHTNALKLIYQVTSFAATVKRHIPQVNRAFRYGEGRKSRIELAKREYDGIFSSEEVEDVKTFFRVLLFILSLFGYFITYGAGFAYLSSRLTNSALEMMQSHRHSYLASNIIWLINAGAILIALPLINHIIIPFWPTINMKLKLGVGFIIHVLSFGIAGFIQWKESILNEQQYFYWMVLPTIFLSVGESFVFVSALEFIYAQSPNNMKGLQTGLFYLTFGIFSAVGSSISFGLNVHDSQNTGSLPAWLCFILVSIGSVGFAAYFIMACCYKNRQRPTTDGSEYDTQRRLIYEDVFDTGSNSLESTVKF